MRILKKIYEDEDSFRYEEITEATAVGENPYYAIIETETGRLPLPWAFPEARTFQGLGRTLVNNPPENNPALQLRNSLPPWVERWVREWEGEW